jgi:hypothetical protein
MIDSWCQWLAAKKELRELRAKYALKDNQRGLVDFQAGAMARRKHALIEAGAAPEDEELQRVITALEECRVQSKIAHTAVREARNLLLTTLDKVLE